MTNRPGTLEYKCRRCGVIFDGGLHTPDVDTTVIRLMVEGDFYAPAAMVSTTTHHSCADGKGFGIADCVGGVYDDPAPAPEVPDDRD